MTNSNKAENLKIKTFVTNRLLHRLSHLYPTVIETTLKQLATYMERASHNAFDAKNMHPVLDAVSDIHNSLNLSIDQSNARVVLLKDYMMEAVIVVMECGEQIIEGSIHHTSMIDVNFHEQSVPT